MLLDSRTRPIHQILEAYLPPEVLAYALRLWSNEYVNQKNISMLSYVDAFYHRQPLPYSRQHIYSSLLPALMEVLKIRSTFDESTTDLYEFPDYDLPGGAALEQGEIINAVSVQAAVPAPPAAPPAEPEPLAPVAAPVPAPAPLVAAPAPAPLMQPAPAAVVPARDERLLAFSTFVRKLMRSLSSDKRRKMLFYYRKSLINAVPQALSASFYEWLQGDGDYFADPALDTQSMSNVVHSIYTGLCNYLGPLDADAVLMKSAGFIDENFDREVLDIRDLL